MNSHTSGTVSRQKLGGTRDERYEFAISLGCPVAERKGNDWNVGATVKSSYVVMEAAYHTFRGKGGRDGGICMYPGAARRAGYKTDYHRAVRDTFVRSIAWIDRDGRAWYVAHNHLYLLPRGQWSQQDASLQLDGEPVSGLALAEMAKERGEVFPHLASLLPHDQRLVRDVIARKPVSAKRLLSIPDAHLRGYVAQRCGGLDRVAAKLPLVERTKDGELRDPSRLGMTTDLLVVRDATSGERFALGVPRRGGKQRTVRNALRSLNGIAQSKIVAQS